MVSEFRRNACRPTATIREPLIEIVRERGPLTVAAFMDLALYDPDLGYYARAAQRSGRAGDFFTSVDVGPLFGELLEVQIAEMAELLDSHESEFRSFRSRRSRRRQRPPRRRHPPRRARARSGALRGVRLHLVEASAAARAAQLATLGEGADRLVARPTDLPESFEACSWPTSFSTRMPVHQVVMRADGLARGVRDCRTRTWVTIEGPLSTPDAAAYLDRLGVTLENGWRVEINLRARRLDVARPRAGSVAASSS